MKKIVVFVILLVAARASATTVTSLADNGPGTLRNALAAATSGETIDFAASLQGQISLTSGELAINQNLTITGPGLSLLTVARTVGVSFRIFNVKPGKVVTIQGLTISGGYSDAGLGAGVLVDNATLTLNGCKVSGNEAGVAGGGIYSSGSLTLSNCVIDNNRAASNSGNPFGDGGGIASSGSLTITRSTIDNNFALLWGGGIVAEGTITVTDSTISNNRAGQGDLAYAYAGGVNNNGVMTLTNCTVSGNSANGRDLSDAGAIHNGSGTLTLANSTVSGNINGGIYNEASPTSLVIRNTILKAGSGPNITNAGGTINSGGYNLSSDNGGGFLNGTGDQINSNPLLGPLQDNGGPTFTHMLLAGSPAINAGDPGFTPPPSSDQRSYGRVWNGRLDIGALESQPVPSPTPTSSPTATVTPTPTPIPTVTGTPSPSPTSTPPTPTPSPGITPSPTPSPTPVASGDNMSTRGFVQTGDNVVISGFILGARPNPRVVVIRGIGPSLARSGFSNFLPDPTLKLYNGNGDLMRENDNWQDDGWQVDTLRGLGLAPTDANEAAIYATLPAGYYTAVLSGKNDGVGVALVEVYLFP